MKLNSPVAALWLVVLIAFFSLGCALYLQHVLQWAPCPLCILQRIGLLLGGVSALVALALGGRGRVVCAGLAILGLSAGALVGGYHLWVLAHPHVSCGADPVELWINAQWWAQTLPWLFEADGLCSKPYPPIAGLSLPAWSVVAHVLGGMAAFKAATAPR